MKNVSVHIVSIIIAIIVWIYIYINGSEIVEISVKLNMNIPKNFVIVSKTNDFYVRILVETNRRFKEYVNGIYEIPKKLKVRGKIFPKKIMVKISKDDIKLPPYFKIIKIADKNISISIDKLRETILPIKLNEVLYEGKQIKDLDISIQPDYMSLKMPTGILRITKFIELNPLVLPEFPEKKLTFTLPIPDKYLPYLQEKIFKVNVSITPNIQQKETTLNIPLSVIFPQKTVIANIKTIKTYPETVTLSVYHSDINIDVIKKNILCYIEIEKIMPRISNIPISCVVKNSNLDTKVKISEISHTHATVKIYRRRTENIEKK